nr:MAG TPA: hypothetical protein [Caudoviricetes sp.]
MRHRFVRTGVFQGAKLYNCNGFSVFCPIQKIIILRTRCA